jgi:hypothetical protein
VSSRPSASVVIGLAVASLAVTSMGAMVASSELLVDAVDRPARRRLDPLVLDLGSVGTIQAELPRDAGPLRPPARRPPPHPPPTGRTATAAAWGGRAHPGGAQDRDPQAGVPAAAATPCPAAAARPLAEATLGRPSPPPSP